MENRIFENLSVCDVKQWLVNNGYSYNKNRMYSANSFVKGVVEVEISGCYPNNVIEVFSAPDSWSKLERLGWAYIKDVKITDKNTLDLGKICIC